MSLITRCPACNTLFKVVADQLRISEGWVRCGQCNEIFDASAQLQEQEAEPAPKARKTPAKKPAATERKPTPARAPATVPATSGPASLRGPTLHEPPDNEAGDGFPPTEGFAAEPEKKPVAPSPPSSPPPLPPQEPSFMRRARPVSSWHRPLVRAVLFVLGLGLSGVLVLQVALTQRDRLVALQPELRPWMEELCGYAQCTVQPLRQIESIVINSSSFNKVRGDVYRLNFTLKNTAATPLAHPAIELSVTDFQDQPIMRRVFPSSEIGPRSGVLPASSESSTSLTLGIKTSGAAERITGYRILAFYP